MNGTRDTGPGQFCPAAYGQNRPGGQFRLMPGFESPLPFIEKN